jgi:hypothetical protein
MIIRMYRILYAISVHIEHVVDIAKKNVPTLFPPKNREKIHILIILIVDYLLTPSVSNSLTHDDGMPAIEEHPLSNQCRHLAYLQRTLSDGDNNDLHDGIGAPLLMSAGVMRGGRVMVVLRPMPSSSSSC